MNSLENRLQQMKFDLNIIRKDYCSYEEGKAFKKLMKEKQPLPDGVNYSNIEDSFYRVVETDLTHEQVKELLLYKQGTYIRTIKNCALFFVVLTLISLFGALIVSYYR